MSPYTTTKVRWNRQPSSQSVEGHMVMTVPSRIANILADARAMGLVT